MAEIVVHSVAELVARLKRDMRGMERKMTAAAKRAAVKGRAVLKRNVPVAFGELRESVHVEGHMLVVDAPHAAAVNNGSRPHWVPLDALIAWVKLRGTQGLLTERQIGRLPGTTTATTARGVAAMLRQEEHRGPAGFSDVDAAERVAKAIQLAIAAHGTKPTHFVEKSLPEIYAILGEELRKELGRGPETPPEMPAGGGGSTAPSGTSSSGQFRKNATTFRGHAIQRDQAGRQFVRLKNGRVHFLTG